MGFWKTGKIPDDFKNLLINARIQTNFEKDKSYFYVSSIAIVFIANILLTSKDLWIVSFILLTISLILFSISIFLAIMIFGKNADYIEAIINENETLKTQPIINLKRKTMSFGLFLF